MSRLNPNKKLWYGLFLLPTMAVLLVVFAYPTYVVISSSFTQWKLVGGRHFIGLDNYVALCTRDRDFWRALGNTAAWVALEATVHVALGVAMALILNKRPRGWKLFRTAYYMPNVVSTSAMAMLFRNIYSPNYGMLNGLLRLFLGTDYTVNWLNDPRTAFVSVTCCWIFYAGLVMIIVYTDISAIDGSVVEAARIDGASDGQLDRLIVLPLARNSIATCVIIAATAKLKEFEMIYLTTSGGPLNLTTNLPLLVYKNAMVASNYGYANAQATVLILLGFGVVMALTAALKIGGEDRR